MAAVRGADPTALRSSPSGSHRYRDLFGDRRTSRTAQLCASRAVLSRGGRRGCSGSSRLSTST
eukprot:1863579-Alexandrium_andersonii.AAC.1